MLVLTIFEKNTPYFQEVYDLFEENKAFFPVWQTLCNTLEACQGHFYIGTYSGDFIGCLFLHKWDDDSVYIGGFSKRKNPHTLDGLELLIKATFEDYPINKILTQIHKSNKPAQFCMKRVGFKFLKQIDNNYIYERNK